MRHFMYKCWDCDSRIYLTLYARDQKIPPPDAVCPGCHQLVEQDYSQKNVMTDIFDPYVEKGITGGPVEFTSKRHRDAVMAADHSTYDSNRYNRGFKRTPWEKDLTYAKAAAIADGQRAEASYESDLD